MAVFPDEVQAKESWPVNSFTDGRKLLVGEEVEVLCANEESFNSWIKGMVIDCQNYCRVVKLDNMLHEKVCTRIVESIPVSKAIEGKLSLIEGTHRSRIRPFPPQLKLQTSELTYGLCVDALTGSWREGVVVDQKHYSTAKLIFFPDRCDECWVPSHQLRLTQEWDEISGNWRRRGKWLFLQIIKEMHKGKIALPELRQVWFQLKSMAEFRENIKLWFSGSKFMWRGLVSDVIEGKWSPVISSTATQSSTDVVVTGKCSIEREGTSSRVWRLSPESNDFSTKCPNRISEHVQPMSSACDRNHRFGKPYTLASGGGMMDEEYGGVSQSKLNCITFKESISDLTEIERHCEVDNFASHHGYSKKLEFSACKKHFQPIEKKARKRLVSRAFKSWKPFKSLKPVEIVGEYCHDVPKFMSSLCESNVHRKGKMVQAFLRTEKTKVKEHLISIGWRIEYRRDNVIRFRYISPQESTYYSLMQVIEYLFLGKTAKDIEHGQVDSGENHLNSSLPDKVPLKKIVFTLNGDQKVYSMSAGLSGVQNAEASSEHSEGNFEISSNCLSTSKNLDLYIDDNELHSAEVITSYMDCIEKQKAKLEVPSFVVKGLRSRTKDYLVEKGWKLWLKEKGVKFELRYTSPSGRTYVSLYAACKGYLGEVHAIYKKMEKVHPECSTKMPSKCINDGKTFNSAVDNLGIVCSNGEQEVYESRQCSGLMTSPGQEHCFVQHESEHHSFSGFGEFCADKENLERNRELKRRKISHPNTDAVVGDRLLPASLIATPCSLKHAEKDHVELSTTERSRGSVTSRVLPSGKKRSRWITVFSSRDKAAKTVLSWLIENNVVLPRQKVAYVRRTDGLILKEGWITNDGIKCRCCLKIFSLSKFEAHNGTKTPSPSASIILQDGRSLLDCQKQIIFPLKPNELQHARFKSNFSNLEVDDVCSVCHDGGMLMICDLCPSAFHPTCIGLQDVPEGNWFCPSCRCEICGLSDYNFEDKDFIEKSGIYCDQCEREYHVGCLRKHGFPLRKRPTGAWTCSKSCSKISDCLGQLLGKPNPTPVKGLSWTIVRNKRNYDGQLDEKTIVEDYGKLHIALDVLHECFEPLHETRTQSDVTADILFNRISRLNRLNFWGFYTMLLMKGEEVVCVATFRIFGEKLAEMPFICTRVKFRRQGMCRLLMDELQKLLSSLAVERLLLPAVRELLKTWTSSFGFTKMTFSEWLELQHHTFLTFRGTAMCHKFLKKPSISNC